MERGPGRRNGKLRRQIVIAAMNTFYSQQPHFHLEKVRDTRLTEVQTQAATLLFDYRTHIVHPLHFGTSIYTVSHSFYLHL